MTPDYGKRKSSNIGNLTVKITADMSGFNEELRKSLINIEIKERMSAIDQLKTAQKETLSSNKMSSMAKGFICNELNEEIDELKEQIKELIDKY